jgi:hypothetical protein
MVEDSVYEIGGSTKADELSPAVRKVKIFSAKKKMGTSGPRLFYATKQAAACVFNNAIYVVSYVFTITM